MQPKLIEPGHGRVSNRCHKGLAPVLYALLERGLWGVPLGSEGVRASALA